jgi:GAF domain-containing protein
MNPIIHQPIEKTKSSLIRKEQGAMNESSQMTPEHIAEALERSMAERDAAYKVGHALSQARELSEFLEAVHEQLSKVIGAQSFYIALRDALHDGELVFPLIAERGERKEQPRCQTSRGLIAHVIATRKPLLLPGQVPERMREMGIEAPGATPSSWLGAPMLVRGKAIGALAVQDFEHSHAYAKADLALLSFVAGQVAVAIENARLYEMTHS